MRRDYEERRAFVTHMKAEHDRLSACVKKIEELWPSEYQKRRSPKSLTHLLDGLQKLRAEMVRHFEEEESGGCVEEAVAAQPSLGREATRLEQEHPELLEQLDALIEKLETQNEPGKPTEGLRHFFHGFARKLNAHEVIEERILEKGFGLEKGR